MNTYDKSSTLTTLEILTRARALIADPNHWMQQDYSGVRDSEGTLIAVPAIYPGANCFCSIGAVHRVDNKPSIAMTEESEALKFLEIVMGGLVSIYNDSHTHAEVLAKFDEAIAAAKAAQ